MGGKDVDRSDAIERLCNSSDVPKHYETVNNGKLDKIDRYKWSREIGAEGEFHRIHKSDLNIDESFQRRVSEQHAKEIAKKWSWAACGALIVAKTDIGLVVVDGQHRLKAAMKRSDITTLPCMVFQNIDNASTFLRINERRKAISITQKFKAYLAAGDVIAKEILQDATSLGYKIPTSPSTRVGGVLHPLRSIYDAYCENMDLAKKSLALCVALIGGEALREPIYVGLYMFGKNMGHVNAPASFDQYKKRLLKIGYTTIQAEIDRYKAVANFKGPSVFGIGVLNAYNKGLKNIYRVDWVLPQRQGRGVGGFRVEGWVGAIDREEAVQNALKFLQ